MWIVKLAYWAVKSIMQESDSLRGAQNGLCKWLDALVEDKVASLKLKMDSYCDEIAPTTGELFPTGL